MRPHSPPCEARQDDTKSSPARSRLRTSGVYALASALLLSLAAADTRASPPAPYVLPWALRPIIAPTVVRVDNTLALYEDAAGQGGVTYVVGLLGGYKVPGTGGPTEGLSLFGRLTAATDAAPGGLSTGAILANPVLGAAYALMLPHGLRLNGSLFAALPFGMGGGNEPNPAQAAVRPKSILARAAMENAIYASNDLVFFPGVGVAWVAHGLTLQTEATALFLLRVRGEERQPEAVKVNFTTGVFAGYFVLPGLLSVGLELRYQRWLKGPEAITTRPETVDTLSFAGGLRVHHELEPGKWLRCGLSYGRGLDAPMSGANYHLVQLDCPFLF